MVRWADGKLAVIVIIIITLLRTQRQTHEVATLSRPCALHLHLLHQQMNMGICGEMWRGMDLRAFPSFDQRLRVLPKRGEGESEGAHYRTVSTTPAEPMP